MPFHAVGPAPAGLRDRAARRTPLPSVIIRRGVGKQAGMHSSRYTHDEDDRPVSVSGWSLAVGVILGIAIGGGVGQLVDQWMIGAAIGLVLGVAFGFASTARRFDE
jgi:hypothetical protein